MINLNKHEQDQSRFANKLCYDLMSELPGMIAMRTRFVHLYVKDMTEGGSGEFKPKREFKPRKREDGE